MQKGKTGLIKRAAWPSDVNRERTPVLYSSRSGAKIEQYENAYPVSS